MLGPDEYEPAASVTASVFANDLFAPPMIDELKRRSFVFRSTPTRVEKAVLGGDAGLYGAAYLPFQARIVTE